MEDQSVTRDRFDDWRYEVANGDTTRGYADWIAATDESESVTHDLSCAERVAGQMASRAADVRKMLAAHGGETICKHCGQTIEEDDTIWRHTDTGECRCDGPDDEDGLAYSDLVRQAEPDEDYTPETLYELAEWIAETNS